MRVVHRFRRCRPICPQIGLKTSDFCDGLHSWCMRTWSVTGSKTATGTLWLCITATVGLATGAVGPAGATPPALPSVAAVVYRSPALPLQVVRPFQAPRTRYGPGHRGVDLAAPAGTSVRPAAVGVVSFAGAVAGRGVVVVIHADGIRTEYEPLHVTVHRGAVVTPLSVLGTVAGPHGGCTACLHWGARRAQDYFDPLTLLSGLGPVRLVPWTGP